MISSAKTSLRPAVAAEAGNADILIWKKLLSAETFEQYEYHLPSRLQILSYISPCADDVHTAERFLQTGDRIRSQPQHSQPRLL